MLDSRILTRVFWASQVALVVKNPPTNAEDVIDASSIPGSGRSPGGGRGSPFQCTEFSRQEYWSDLPFPCVCVRACVRVCVCVCARTLEALQNGNLEARILKCFAISMCVCVARVCVRTLEARILKWFAISSSRVSSRPRDWSRISSVYCIAGRFFTAEPLGKPILIWVNPIL